MRMLQAVQFGSGKEGFGGAVLITTMSYYPLVYLPVAAALRGMDPAFEELGRALGNGPWRTFARVVLPQLRPALLGLSCLLACGIVVAWMLPRRVPQPAAALIAVNGERRSCDTLDSRIVLYSSARFNASTCCASAASGTSVRLTARTTASPISLHERFGRDGWWE